MQSFAITPSLRVKTTIHTYTRIAWTNPTTHKAQSEIFDEYQPEALEFLKELLDYHKIVYEEDVLRPH